MRKKALILILMLSAAAGVFFASEHFISEYEKKQKEEKLSTLEQKMPYVHATPEKMNMTADQGIQYMLGIQKTVKKRYAPYSIDPYQNYSKAAKRIRSKILITWTDGGLQEVYDIDITASRGSVKLYKALWEIEAEKEKKEKSSQGDSSSDSFVSPEDEDLSEYYKKIKESLKNEDDSD